MKKFLLIVGLALLAVWFWLKTKAVAAEQSPGGASPSVNIGAQVGSNLTVNETTGSVLAKAISQIFDSGKQGSFKYVGPDFTLETSTADLGGRTMLRRLMTLQEFNDAWHKVGSHDWQAIGFSIFQIPSSGGYNNYCEVIGVKQPLFNANDPSTFIII